MSDERNTNVNVGGNGVGCLMLVLIIWLVLGGGFGLINAVLRHLAGM